MFNNLSDRYPSVKYEETVRKIQTEEKIRKEFNMYDDTKSNSSEQKKSLIKRIFSRKNKEKEIER